MFRKVIANKIEGDNGFQFRGHEVRRIEAFSDAVFAFAVTLLIVSLEVPKSFEELMVTMRGFFAFGVSFLLLMLIWYEQNIFFRRYGLDDLTTIILNCTLLFSGQIYGDDHSPLIMKITDIPKLMVIYGTGYIFIYLLFSFMYIHALKKRDELKLTAAEIFDTKTKFYKNAILIIIGLISVIITLILDFEKAGFAGFVYFLIGPAFSVFFRFRANRKQKLFLKNT
jgi:uncharacterized membrane protein